MVLNFGVVVVVKASKNRRGKGGGGGSKPLEKSITEKDFVFGCLSFVS